MKFPYGIANFELLRSEEYLYIDKTRFIEALELAPERAIVFLRPRRFGKTLFVNMLGWYYNRLNAARFDELFNGTYIGAHPTPRRNSYMILSFNFSGINTQTLENANSGFSNEVHSSIELFLGKYQEYFTADEIKAILGLQKPNDILNELFKQLEKKGLGKCVYVLIDEYDHFANNILSQGKEMFKNLVRTDGYVRPFYEALKKGMENVVDRLFITGIMPILLDSLTSGFNVAKNKSTDAELNDLMGFTEEEIMPILRFLGDEKNLETIRAYYNGYRFSPEVEHTIYNSDMILYYAGEYRPLAKRAPKMIDMNVVSDYRKIRAVLSIGKRELEEKILTQIVEQNRVSLNAISEFFVLTEETEFLFDSKALISLLFYMGYLTIAESGRMAIVLSMPNQVLKSLYLDYMEYVLMRRAKMRIDGMDKDEMLRELVDGRIDLLIALTERFLKGLSNRDYERFDEKYIKLVMLSLLSDVNIYLTHSEYEVNADGYADLYLQAAFDPQRSTHYFIELKYVKANASKSTLDTREREGVAAMQRYLDSGIARSIPNKQAYVLVFRKDKCVRKKACVPPEGGLLPAGNSDFDTFC